MHPTHAIRLRLAACLVGLLLTAVLGCASRQNPWIAPDQGQFLVEKVKTNQNAYLRYAEAEEDARRDGNAEALERYQQAKETARQEYERYNRELTQYRAEHPQKALSGTP